VEKEPKAKSQEPRKFQETANKKKGSKRLPFFDIIYSTFFSSDSLCFNWPALFGSWILILLPYFKNSISYLFQHSCIQNRASLAGIA